MNPVFNSYCKRTKIDISDWCNGDERYITLREPNVGEMKAVFRLQSSAKDLKEDGSNMEDIADAMEKFGATLPLLIVEHNFYKIDKADEKIPVKDVAEFILSKFDLTSWIIESLVQSLSLVTANKGKSQN